MRAAVQSERRVRERARLVPVVRGVKARHDVRCPGCAARFELFGARWCACEGGHRSKVCGGCGQCACVQPSYRDPRMWAKAPPLFVREGFEKLFVAYL